jgi:hypothetical protein
VFLSLQETSIQGGVCDWVKDRTLHSDKLMFFQNTSTLPLVIIE